MAENFSNISNTPKVESFSTLEALKNSLTTLKDKLVLIKNMPGYEDVVKDLLISIANLEARIASQKN